ncbi:MAG: rhodanese-like domain-containing protein [Oscillatoriophycideae cyanobacterium NC_groundwater_1537_Pr4_S-0.65um_50_18]|nr:rhodanese-like domain-containing protein [Oscillatoriophycideae cyanobacterium NC_groundwater_1537_Pr4_S-0.65um_50_18]
MFQRTIQVLLLGFFPWVSLSVDVGQSSVFAAPLMEIDAIPQSSMQALPQRLDLESQVDRFLTSIPANYYTIATVEALKTQLENPQTLLVDVREPSEYQSGHIPNAITIPLRTLAHNLAQIPHDCPVVLYCSSGYRSAMGVMTLHLLGYENVRGFPPSFKGWQAAGEAIASR